MVPLGGSSVMADGEDAVDESVKFDRFFRFYRDDKDLKDQ